MNKKGVLFDVGNTLIQVYPSVGEIYASSFALLNIQVSEAAINASFRELFYKTTHVQTHIFSFVSKTDEKSKWKEFLRKVFIHAGQWEQVEPVFDAWFLDIYSLFSEPCVWRIFPEVTSVLQQLHDQKMKMGIVSNWDSRLRDLIDQMPMKQYFDTIVISAFAGYAKPDSRIFEIALKEMNLEPEEVVYVGDDLFFDYQGARNAGILPVIVARDEKKLAQITSQYKDFEQMVILNDLSELPELFSYEAL